MLRRIAIASAISAAVLGQAALAAERTGTLPPQAVAAAESLPAATDVRVGGDDKMTRFVVDLTQKVDITAFALANPYRVVIDLPQIAFKLPAKAAEQSRGLVKAFRYGLIMQGGSRIVLDTKGPVRVEKAFVLAATGDQPARLVVDLSATDRDSFNRAASLENRAPRSPPVKPSDAAQPAGD